MNVGNNQKGNEICSLTILDTSRGVANHIIELSRELIQHSLHSILRECCLVTCLGCSKQEQVRVSPIFNQGLTRVQSEAP